MSSIFAPSFFVLALLGQAASDEADVAKFAGTFLGNKYTVSLNHAAIQKTPDWSGDEENPPISARKAAKLATEMKDSLAKGTKASNWKLSSLSLMKIEGKWLWTATFTPGDEELLDELRHSTDFQDDFPQLTLPVLMDGTVIKPEFEKMSE